MKNLSKKHLKAYQESFQKNLKDEQVNFKDDELMPVSFSPRFFSQKRYEELKANSLYVLQAIEVILRLYIDNKDIQDLFPELKKCRSLSTKIPPYKNWIYLARFDFAETFDGRFQMMETNCDCPGGLMFTPRIQRAHKNTSFFQKLFKVNDFIEQPVDSEEILIRNMINTFQDVRKTHRRPNIAFLNSHYHPLYTELKLFEETAKKMGLNSKSLAFQDLTDCRGKLGWNDIQMDIAYQKFDAFIDEKGNAVPCIHESEEIAKKSLYQKAMNKDEFLYFNSFPSSLIAENKRIMALLVDPTFQRYFTYEQKKAIKSICPKSFCLDNTLEYKDKIDEVLLNKDKYVLKKVIDTRGRGVFIGKFMSQDKWKECVFEAIHKPFVVQEYITPYTYMAYGTKIIPEKEKVTGVISMYLIQGKPVGICCRSSNEAITNISRNGFAQPIYILNSQKTLKEQRNEETKFLFYLE